LKIAHPEQRRFIDSTAKRKIIRAGRRGGKTTGVAILAARAFLDGKRVLYAVPTQDQADKFWYEITSTFAVALERGLYKKNETRRYIEKGGSENRIRCKTAFNADTLRGDYADLLILDEFMLMHEGTWADVGAPMLLDNDGDAVFVYTPPSRRTRHLSRADDPRHASKLYAKADADATGRWAAFHFTSRDNPHISAQALGELAGDMTAHSIRQEIDAEDLDDVPGALWTRSQLDADRTTAHPDLRRIVVGVDPSTTAGGDACGIVVVGIDAQDRGYVLDDRTLQGSPSQWAHEAVSAYHRHKADRLVAESNQGGEMVRLTISTIPGAPPVSLVHASRGKITRAEPVAASYEQHSVHHVGTFADLEDELVSFDGTGPSPNRLDALVYACTELGLGGGASDGVYV
jgi:Terminase RNaseH-like domain/Terminase large subunit, T4likevirus-type, N-terminal